MVQIIPAIPDGAHTLGFRHPIELGRLLQILLAPDPLRVAEPSLGQGVTVTPGTGYLKTAQSQCFVLLDAPPAHVAHPELVDAESELRPPRVALREVGRLPFLYRVLVVGDSQTGRVGRFPQPRDPFPLVRSHTPTVAAGERIEQHSGRMILLRRDAEMISRLVKRPLLVTLDAFGKVVFGADFGGTSQCPCGPRRSDRTGRVCRCRRMIRSMTGYRRGSWSLMRWPTFCDGPGDWGTRCRYVNVTRV